MARCEEYRPKVYNTIYNIVRNRDDSEELTQEVMVAALENRGKIRDMQALEKWLIRIAHNRALNFHTRDREHRNLPLTAPGQDKDDAEAQHEAPQPGPNAQVISDQIRERIERAVRYACPDELDHLILMRTLRDDPPDEIAETLGMNPSTCRARLRRSRMKFLVHLFLYEADLLGGSDGIAEAVQAAARHERFDPDEGDALLRAYVRLVAMDMAGHRGVTEQNCPRLFLTFVTGLAGLVNVGIPLPKRLESRYFLSFVQAVAYVVLEKVALSQVLLEVLFAAYTMAASGDTLSDPAKQELREQYSQEVEGRRFTLRFKWYKKKDSLCNPNHLEMACWKLSTYLRHQMSIVVEGY